MNELLDLIATDLETKGPDANGWHTARCPFHDDRHPSLRIAAHGFICMGCGEKGNLEKLAGRLGMASAESPRGGLKVAELARAKGVPEAFLRSLGVADGWAGSGSDRVSCVDIPYLDEDGNVTAVRKRLSLYGSKRFVWRRGDHPSLYGLWLLPNVRKAGKVMLVEGESDCWALWHARVHALGVPGASTWKQQYRSVVDGLEVYVWHEPDSGGDGLVRAAANDIPSLRIIEPPAGIKDPSELYLKDPEGFHEQIRVLIATAKRFADVRAEALSTEARKAFEVAQQLLDDPHLLRRLYSVLAESGFAGDPRPASLAYIAITSRLVPRPMNVAYIAPSGAGKNAAIDAVLPLFPPEAVYVVRASSPRALVFNDALFTHRTVVVTEADSLPEEGPAASAIRSLMSDGEMAYEIVEKGEDGRHITRRVVKPGPTGIITTSVRPLGEQASTRCLTASISDASEQTRLVLHAQVERLNGWLASPNVAPWVEMQRWLAFAGEHRVVIPYGQELAAAMPVEAVRMRRDFAQLLSAVQAMAILHQRQRARDETGRIIATLEDYEMVRSLLEPVFIVTTTEGATPAICDTVAAVTRLAASGPPVTEAALVRDLQLAKSTVSYRVRRAIEGGWLVNQETRKNHPFQLVVGAPLPENCRLPDPRDISLRAGNHVSDSNLRTGRATAVSSESLARFEPASNRGSSAGTNGTGIDLPEAFERFEPTPKQGSHTEAVTGGDPTTESAKTKFPQDGSRSPDDLQEWRRVSIPEWRRILATARADGDSSRAEYAAWMLRDVLTDEIEEASP